MLVNNQISYLYIQERPFCSISKQSSLAKVLKETMFIVWNESTMVNKGGPEALDRTLKNLRADERPMEGVVILFAGDFRQTLPVVPRGTKSDEINACLKSSFLTASRTLLDLGNGNILNNDGEVVIEPTFAFSVRHWTRRINS